jgi:hypothetical protein
VEYEVLQSGEKFITSRAKTFIYKSLKFVIAKNYTSKRKE